MRARRVVSGVACRGGLPCASTRPSPRQALTCAHAVPARQNRGCRGEAGGTRGGAGSREEGGTCSRGWGW
eukprot:25912-Rhodomonas_salina.1